MIRQNLCVIGIGIVVAFGSPLALQSQATGHHHASGARPNCEARPASDPCAADEYLIDRLAVDGLPTAMAALDSLAAVDAEVRRLGHNYAHAIGLAAFTSPQEVSEVFGNCTPAFQSGCYHGVIQSYFGEHSREHGDHVDPELVQALCAEQRSDPSQRWLLFQCVHGLGHGLMMVVDHHLPTALEGCDHLADRWEQEVCYGAVFMENIVHSTAPHHSVGRPAAVDEAEPGGGSQPHGGHQMTSRQARDEFPALDPERPLYPCTELPGRYLLACYQMQTSAVLHFNGRDIADAGRVCLTAPELFRSTCFQSLGRDISAMTVQDHERALELCGRIPTEYEPFCHLGYAKNVIDQTSNSRDGVEFCALLSSAASKRACYIGVGEQLLVLHPEPAMRQTVCGGVEAAYVEDCLFGAALRDAPGSAVPAEARETRRSRGRVHTG